MTNPTPRTSRRYWRPLEDEIIRQYYPRGGSKAVLEHLQPVSGTRRSSGAVCARAANLGVARVGKSGHQHGQSWTPDEDAVLRRYYPMYGAAGVSAKLGGSRTVDVVRARASAIGLRCLKGEARARALQDEAPGTYTPKPRPMAEAPVVRLDPPPPQEPEPGTPDYWRRVRQANMIVEAVEAIDKVLKLALELADEIRPPPR